MQISIKFVCVTYFRNDYEALKSFEVGRVPPKLYGCWHTKLQYRVINLSILSASFIALKQFNLCFGEYHKKKKIYQIGTPVLCLTNTNFAS